MYFIFIILAVLLFSVLSVLSVLLSVIADFGEFLVLFYRSVLQVLHKISQTFPHIISTHCTVLSSEIISVILRVHSRDTFDLHKH